MQFSGLVFTQKRCCKERIFIPCPIYKFPDGFSRNCPETSIPPSIVRLCIVKSMRKYILDDFMYKGNNDVKMKLNVKPNDTMCFVLGKIGKESGPAYVRKR